MTPHAKQLAFIVDPARFCLAHAGAQSGKTRGAAPKFVWRIARDLRENPGSRRLYWVVDPTYRLARVPQRYVREICEAYRLPVRWSGWMGGKVGLYSRAVWTHPNGASAELEFLSAEHPEHLVAEAVDGIWVNEAARLKEGTWSSNLMSRLMATGGWAILDSSPTGENWLFFEVYKLGLKPGHADYDAELADDEYSTHTWSAKDNPAIPVERIEKLHATLPTWAYLREVEGDPHHFAGQLFPHWRDEINVRRVNLDEYPEVELTADFGFGVGHPFVVLVVGVDRPQRRVGIAEEHVNEGMLATSQVDLVRQLGERHSRVRRLTGDSADPQMLAMFRAMRQGRHIDVVGADKRTGSVYAGTYLQADLIGCGTYVVDPTCKVTIRQHKGARWKPVKANDPSGAIVEEPLRKDDDTVAAARYLVYPRLRSMREAA